MSQDNSQNINISMVSLLRLLNVADHVALTQPGTLTGIVAREVLNEVRGNNPKNSIFRTSLQIPTDDNAHVFFNRGQFERGEKEA